MSVSIRSDAVAVTVSTIGEIDADTVPNLESLLRTLADELEQGVLVLDVEQVTFMDSSGLRLPRPVGQRSPGVGQAAHRREPNRSHTSPHGGHSSR